MTAFADSIAGKIRSTLAQARASMAAKDGQGRDVIETHDPVHGGTLKITFPEPHFRFPAEEFEQRYGVTAISRRYVLPPGIDEKILQAYAQVLRHQEIRGDACAGDALADIWLCLQSLNSSLSSIDVRGNFYDAVQGVASRINPDDIMSFVSGARHLPDTALTMNWLPSEKTQNLIAEQLDQSWRTGVFMPRLPSLVVR